MESAPEQKPATWVGYAFALGATIIWSGNFIVARGLNNSISPATLAFLRWFTATLALLPIAFPSVSRERHFIWRHLRYLLLTAFLGVTVFNTVLYLAARSTSALNLSLIAISSPIFTLLFARVLLGEALTLGRAAGLVSAVLGVIILVTRGDVSLLKTLEFSIGDLWMALAAMIFGIYTVLVKLKPQQMGQATFLFSTFAMGLILLAPWTIWEVSRDGVPQFNGALLGSVLYIGLGASLASYFLWTKAIAVVGPARSGFIYYTLPVFSGLEAFLLLGEPVGWVHAVSGLLILSGIVLATRS